MRDVTITLEGLTPYSASMQLEEKKKPNESWDDYETRIWREKAHANEKGEVYIPGIAFKKALDSTAKLLKVKIKGKSNATYAPLFVTGTVAMSDLYIGVKKTALEFIRLQVSSTGRPTGSRVPRWFPYIREWKGALDMRIFNDEIQEPVFEHHFVQAGLLAGVGRGRPENGSVGNGRFRPTSFKWSELK